MIRWEELKTQEVHHFDLLENIRSSYMEDYTWGTVIKRGREYSCFKISRNHKTKNKFRVSYLHGGILESLGYFKTLEEAKKKAETYWEVNK